MTALDFDLVVPAACFVAVLVLLAYHLLAGPRVLQRARARLRREHRRELLALTCSVPLWPLQPLEAFWPDDLRKQTTGAVGAPAAESPDLEERSWVREA